MYPNADPSVAAEIYRVWLEGYYPLPVEPGMGTNDMDLHSEHTVLGFSCEEFLIIYPGSAPHPFDIARIKLLIGVSFEDF